MSIDGIILDLMIQFRTRTPKVIFDKNEEVKILFDKSNLLSFSEDLTDSDYSNTDRDRLRLYIDIKCDVVINKAKKSNFIVIFLTYIDLMEDYFDLILSKNPTQLKSQSTRSTFIDIGTIEDSDRYKQLLTPNSCEEMISNLEKIQNDIKYF